jgi:repressor LexA
MPQSHDLTARQRELLAALERLHRLHGYSPSMRELGDAVGVSSTSTVHHHVTILAERGLVERLPGTHRTLRPAASSAS